MKRFFKYIFSLSTIILILSSCGKNNHIGQMIPADALFVARIDLKSIESKLPLEDIRQSEWFKEAIADPSAPEWRKKIIENPSASGIDLDDALIFFVSKNSGENYIVAEGKIKNENDFEQFNKNLDSSKTVQKEGGINLLSLRDKGIVGWNEKYFAYVTSAPENPYKDFKWDDTTGLQPGSPVDNSARLSAFCKNLFSLKTDSSLATNDKFGALIKEGGDIQAWQNNEALIKSTPSLSMISMLKLDAFTKDNIVTYTVNFENGRIAINQNAYVSKELSDVLKKYAAPLNMKMITSIPSQDVVGLLALNFKPEGIKELIKLTGADGLVNSYGQQMGINLDDLSKATNGDLLLAFCDLKMAGATDNKNDSSADMRGYDNFMPAFNYIFSVGIGDKTSFQKILDLLKKTGAEMGADSLVNKYVMNDKTFAYGSSLDFANKFLSGKSNNAFDFSGNFSGHPFGFFLNIHKLISEFSDAKSIDSIERAMADQSLNTWNNIISYGGDFKGNAFQFHTEINLVNKDTNSLKQLNHYFNEMYKLDRDRKNQDNARLDSLLVPPPIDTVKVK